MKRFSHVRFYLQTVLISCALVCFSSFQAVSAEVKSSEKAHLIEKVGFEIHNLEIFHQNYDRTLNVKVTYGYKDGETTPNVLEVKQTVLQQILQYPNKIDYWEIMNKNIVTALVSKYNNTINELSMEIAPEPDDIIPFHRKSVVVYDGESVLKEFFGFKMDFNASQCGFSTGHFDVFYRYKDNPKKEEYPDFRWLSQFIDKYLDESWGDCNFNSLKEDLTQRLKKEFPVVTCIDVEMKI